MSKINILLFLSAINLILSEANLRKLGGQSRQIGQETSRIHWSKSGSVSGLCKDEQQQIVEYFSYRGKQYLFFSQQVTWEEARMLCVNYDAKLAILNDIDKATVVAKALSHSDTATEDIWLGGRRIDAIWTWIDSEETAWRKNILSIESDVDNFPPWSREPTRPTKECLGIDRRSHDYPNFVDLDCRLLRPFICEQKPEDSLKSPVPSKRIEIQRSTFTLYHGKLAWDEAATFCRKRGARLAILKNTNLIEILTNSMAKTRPDFETVWIGAHFSYGQWIWMATGAILNSVTDNGFPPWRSGRAQQNEGCILLDRHLGGNINFIETSCDRKRDFVCEEYPQNEEDEWLNDPVKFSHKNETYIIYSEEKTWKESYDYCKEKGSVLVYMEDMNTTDFIVEAMGDHPKGITHVWTGGVYNSNSSHWVWNHNHREIPSEKDRFGFPPWADIKGEFNFYNEASTCLNLDRSDHVKAHLYGLDCSNKQNFVCKITCNIPPEVKNGNWTCEPTNSGNNCTMECERGYIMMGLKNAFCSPYEGWTSANNWLEFPACIEPTEYVNRLLRSLGYEVQKIVGYYFILDHWNEKMKQLSIKFTEQLLTIFPVNRELKMGMTSYITDPSSHLHFNQTDSCLTIQSIRELENKISGNLTNHDNYNNSWFKEISMYTGRKTLIIAFIDRNHAKRYGEIMQQLITAGHHIAIIGSREDGDILLPLVTVGLEKKVNLFLFDPQEFENVVKEMKKMKGKITAKCPENKETPSSTIINAPSNISTGVGNHKTEVTNNISSLDQNSDVEGYNAELTTNNTRTLGTTSVAIEGPQQNLNPSEEGQNKESAIEEAKNQTDNETIHPTKDEQNIQIEDPQESDTRIYNMNDATGDQPDDTH